MDRASSLATERAEIWRITFRHSTGALGRHALAAQHNSRELFGWRSGHDQTVLYPPREQGGTGEWVRLGSHAELLTPLIEPEGSPTLARVRLDGAQCGMFAQVAATKVLRKGARLRGMVRGSAVTFCPEDAE